MSALIERLRAVLGHEYEIERELGVGGMGMVFLGRERSLDRQVAIKILRPELATAVAAERFQREARMLAAVSHPSVVTIHRVGEAGGLYFFVMEHLTGTLADRLARHRMSVGEVVRLGTDLLEGLARVHDREIVHRDIKPSNVFLRDDGRAVLGDFGIARSLVSSDPGLTATGHYLGTPDYMAPEQFLHADVSPAADQYAVGMVCYEALTGQRWKSGTAPLRGDWTGVPARVRTVLQRALALDPASRWPDAREFAGTLAATQRVRRAVWGTAAAAALVTVAGLAVLLVPPATGVSPDSDVAVLPFTVAGGTTDIGEVLAIWVEQNLRRAFGDSGLRVTPTELTVPWFARFGDDTTVPATAWDDLRTRRVVRGRVRVMGDTMVVVATLVSPDGVAQPLGGVRGARDDLMGVGYGVAAEITRVVRGRTSEFRGLSGGNVAAWKALIDAEYAFEHDNWGAAEASYLRAIALDSSLAAAWWGLYNVRRWRRAPSGMDLAEVSARYAQGFGDVEGLLIEADLAPTVPERVALLRSAIDRFPYDPYPRLLLGNELFHRGAFAGLGLDSAVAALQAAARANPYLASTYSMLTWALTRLGDASGAREALAVHARLAPAQPEADFCMTCVLQLAWAERFLPGPEAARVRNEVLLSPDGAGSLARAVRLGLSFGLPRAQRAIGEELAAMPDPRLRTVGLIASALALLAEGHVPAALEHLERAARADDDAELAFEAQQWRLVLTALGVPGVPEDQVRSARSAITAEAQGARADRAHWTLLLDALASGGEAERHWTALADRPDTLALRALGAALMAAARGDTTRAVAIADSLRHHVLAAAVEDPLQRAVLFLRWGEWLAGRDPDAADQAWRWYENADLPTGWPEGYPQAAELDWALEPFARYRRAALAHAQGNAARACQAAVVLRARWAGAEPAYQPLRRELDSWTADCVKESGT